MYHLAKKAATVGACALQLVTAGVRTNADVDHALVRLPSTAKAVGHLSTQAPVSFALSLPLRDRSGLNTFIDQVNDPSDPQYHHYLTPAEFADRFGPSTADYETLQSEAKASGLTVTQTYKSRTMLDVAGPSGAVEALFGVKMTAYVDAAGHYYHIPDRSAQVTGELASIGAVPVGLDDAPAAHPYFRAMTAPTAKLSPTPVGFSPAQIKKAYSVSASLTGAGQTLALMELDGYSAGDIQQYRNEWGISGTPIQNIMVDNFDGSAGAGANEVVLDIDMFLAMCDNATALLVYEAPDTGASTLDCYARIADDDRATVASTSWGLAENAQSRSFINSEDQIFAQMAAQGQSMFSAAGDNGAFDNPNTPSTLTVDDPAAQPDVTGCGGTTLTVNILGNWSSETTWDTDSNDAGGGGASMIWPIPAYQSKAGLSGPNRLVPDVSIDADPNTGYAVYFSGGPSAAGWEEIGGTSAAAPLWAGIIALANQVSRGNGGANMGLANTAIYRVASTPATYSRDFHDIADNSNNLHYVAGPGYDEATGWGTPITSSLVSDLAAPPSTGTGNVHAFSAGLQLFSIPYDYSGLSISSVFDQPVTLYYWDPLTFSYVTSPNPPADTVHQMLGYWANFSTTTNAKNTGTDLTSGQSNLSITLQAGWNMLGNPYNQAIPLSKVTITPLVGGSAMSLAQADQDQYVYQTLFSYDPSTHQYVAHTTDSLEPYTGYWVKAFQSCKITVTP